ncbi:MAG: DUF58 domain-containing protein [Planctomycetes bacterium]|nr:DUF58 domain-containing protein [Planctomycetota bacterium]
MTPTQLSSAAATSPPLDVAETLRPASVRVRLTRPGRVLLFVAAAALVAGWVGAGIVFSLIATFGAAVAAAAALAALRHASALRIAAPPPVSAFAGERFAIDVVVANRARRATAFDVTFSILDADGAHRRIGAFLARLGAGETSRIDVLHPVLRRGVHPQGRLELDSAFPLGLAECRLVFVLPSEVVVLPRLGAIRRLAAAQVRGRMNFVHGRAGRGDEQEVDGVRAWREGESLRGVHWKLSARRGRLLVREFRSQPRPMVHVILSTLTPLATAANRAGFEDAVSLAATLVEHHVRREHAVRLTLLGRTPRTITCRRGRGGMFSALRALADVTPEAAGGPSAGTEAPLAVRSGERVFVVRSGGGSAHRVEESCRRDGSSVRVLDVADRATSDVFDRVRRPGHDVLLGVRS